MMFAGFLARSRVIIVAVLLMLLLAELGLNNYEKFLINHGIEVGLIFLMMALFAILLENPPNLKEFLNLILSEKGMVAFMAGLLATKFNQFGLELLKEYPIIIIAIMIGSLSGIIFFAGIPVGPLMAGALAAIFLEIINFIKELF